MALPRRDPHQYLQMKSNPMDDAIRGALVMSGRGAGDGTEWKLYRTVAQHNDTAITHVHTIPQSDVTA